MRMLFLLSPALLAVVAAGCGPADTPRPDRNNTEAIAAERAKLSAEDRVLVEAQEWCVISGEQRLGSMGPPIKLDIKGQPVFICCAGCRKKAEADPDATLAKLELRKQNAHPTPKE